jgi:hypothetical protein
MNYIITGGGGGGGGVPLPPLVGYKYYKGTPSHTNESKTCMGLI